MKPLGLETLRVADIIKDERFQVRAKMRPRKVQDYAAAYQSGAVLPPIKVAQVNGAMFLVDGWHRLAALEALEWDQVEAEVVEATLAEAQWLAGEGNLTHGIQLTSKELRKAFNAYVRAGMCRKEGTRQYKSYAEIALEATGGARKRHCVRLWMKEDHPSVFRKMGGDEPTNHGTERPEGKSTDEALLEIIKETVAKAGNTFTALSNPEARGVVIQEMEEALERMKADEYIPQPPPDF